MRRSNLRPRSELLSRALLLLTVTACLAFTADLFWGFLSTERMGAPSVSRMIADNYPLDAFLAAQLFLYGISLIGITVVQLSYDHSGRERALADFYDGLGLLAVPIGAGEFLFLTLVCVVSVDEDEDGHYIVAGLGVILGWVHGTFMFVRRCVRYECSSNACGESVVLIYNGCVLVLLFAMIVAFGVLVDLNEHDYSELVIGNVEYAIFWLLILKDTFQIVDAFELGPRPKTQKET